MSEAAAIPQGPAAGSKGVNNWRGTKPAGFILHPERFMETCVGMEVSVRVMNGAKWVGILKEVKDNGSIVIKPAQEMLYDKPDGAPLPEKELVKGDILWLRRHPDGYQPPSDTTSQPQDEPHVSATIEKTSMP